MRAKDGKRRKGIFTAAHEGLAHPFCGRPGRAAVPTGLDLAVRRCRAFDRPLDGFMSQPWGMFQMAGLN
jgi:hypothetical protein